MTSDRFISDFERTVNSDHIHAVLGRALIIATRFDSMCEAAVIAIEVKKNLALKFFLTDEEYESQVNKILSKYRTLNGNIKSIGLNDNLAIILHSARKARNNIAHSISKGLTGCLDNKFDEAYFIEKLSNLIIDIAHGDIAISYFISLINNEPALRTECISSYRNSIVQWVVKR